MNSRRSELLSIGIILLIILALIGLTWANYRYSTQNPGGSDFLPRWVGTRLFIFEGQNPYGDETSREIQEMMFGRVGHPDDDEILFFYPFHSIYVFAPYALVGDYDMARALWMTTLEVSVILLVAASLSLSRWRLSPLMLGILLVFAALWYHSVRPIINGNPSVLVALMIAAAMLAIRVEQDGLAGFLLAISTIKPQMVVLLIPFMLIWSISRKRWALFWGFLGSLALLVASVSLFVPDWILQNLRQVLVYPDYTIRAIIVEWVPGVGNQLSWAITIFLAVVLLWEWRAALEKEFYWFFWTACLTLVITNLIGLRTATANYIALFPALVLVLASWDREWGILGRSLIIFSFLLLFFGLWWLFLTTLQMGDQPIQHPIMFLPLPVLLLVGLYWVRWWVLRPKGPLLARLSRSRSGEFRF